MKCNVILVAVSAVALARRLRQRPSGPAGLRARELAPNRCPEGLFSATGGDDSPVDGTVSFMLTVNRWLRAASSLTLKSRMQIDHAGLRGVVYRRRHHPALRLVQRCPLLGPMRAAGKLTDGMIRCLSR